MGRSDGKPARAKYDFAVRLRVVKAALQDEISFGARGVHADKTALLVSGEAALVKGTVTIALPAWFEPEAKASTRTVQLTCKGGWSALWTSVVIRR